MVSVPVHSPSDLAVSAVPAGTAPPSVSSAPSPTPVPTPTGTRPLMSGTLNVDEPSPTPNAVLVIPKRAL